MAQLKIPASDFRLLCKFTCQTKRNWQSNGEPHSQDVIVSTTYGIFDAPDPVYHTVHFNLDIPKGATITSAKVCATTTTPLYGAEFHTINGQTVGTGGSVSCDVTIPDEGSTIDVVFRFKCKTPTHNHSVSGFGDISWTNSDGMYGYEIWKFNHESYVHYTDVYLLIDYKPPIEFTGWTDDPLVVGETYVKAVHMTELQQWAALLSEYADNGTPTFTEAVPGETSLALWLSQVQEIRAVLDVINPDHEQWLDVSVNCPRADVMTQLRDVIVSAM